MIKLEGQPDSRPQIWNSEVMLSANQVDLRPDKMPKFVRYTARFVQRADQLLVVLYLVDFGEHDVNRLVEILQLLQDFDVLALDATVRWNAEKD